MPPSAEELRELQKKAVQSVENPPDAEVRASRAFDGEAAGLPNAITFPLAVALFVDLCLFLVSMGQRPANRLDGLVPKMKAAERGPVIEILSRFNDIHRDQTDPREFRVVPPRRVRHERRLLRRRAARRAAEDEPGRARGTARRSPTAREPVRELRERKDLQAHAAADHRQHPEAARTAGFEICGLGIVSRLQVRAGRLVRHHPRRRHGRRSPCRSGRGRRSEQPPTRLAETGCACAAGCAGTQPETPAPSFDRHAASSAPTLSIDPQHAMRFGPYAETYRPDPASPPYYAPPRTRRTPAAQSEADATVKAANSNTARTAPIVQPPSRNTTATVVPMPRAQHSAQDNDDANSQSVRDPAMARVTLQRETATFTVPGQRSRHPRLTQSGVGWRRSEFGRTLSGAGNGRLVDVLPVREPAPAGHEPPPRLPEDQLSAEDRAFIRRIAPPAAE